MLTNAKALAGYKLDGIDGEIGRVKEFYFDDNYWTVRYLVADTKSWLMGRTVLISPHAIGAISESDENIAIQLTKKQIEDSPSWTSERPVSQQFEESYYAYYGWPTYWGGSYMWGNYPAILRSPTPPLPILDEKPKKSHWDPHLRSTAHVNGYHIHASDGEIGHVVDFVVDDTDWAIRYLVIDTRNWWPGKKILISPHWIESVNWDESKLHINLTRDQIQHAPEYTEETLLRREYESNLHQHYSRDGYWADDAVREVTPA